MTTSTNRNGQLFDKSFFFFEIGDIIEEKKDDDDDDDYDDKRNVLAFCATT